MGGSTNTLISLGVAPEPALLIGDQIAVVSGKGTTQTGAAVLSGTVNAVTTSAGQSAFILKNHNQGRTVEVYNTSPTDALVFPPVGAAIDGGSVNASVSVLQGIGRKFRYITPLIIKSILGSGGGAPVGGPFLLLQGGGGKLTLQGGGGSLLLQS